MSMRTFIDAVVMFFESPLHVEDFPLCDSLLNVWIVDSKLGLARSLSRECLRRGLRVS